MEIQLLYHVANTQDGINLQDKRQNTHLSHVIYEGKGTCGQTYIGETARNLEVRVNEHSDVKKQSEPAKHITKHPNHKFSWKVLTTAHSWLKMRIKEAFYIACFRPDLNKQVQSLDLTFFPWEQVLHNWHYLNYNNTERMHIISL